MYQDEWSRWHDKPCVNGEPSSNNGWLYTAYGVKLGMDIDMSKLMECALACIHGEAILRSPNKPLPPISRDEILGMFYLGFIGVKGLEDKGWSFSPVKPPPFNPLKTIASFILAYGEHRNYLWKKELTHAYRFMFSVPIQDRSWMMRHTGMKVPLLYRLYTYVSSKVSAKSRSSKLIAWLKDEVELDIEALKEEMGENHPFIEAARRNYGQAS